MGLGPLEGSSCQKDCRLFMSHEQGAFLRSDLGDLMCGGRMKRNLNRASTLPATW